MPVSKFEKPVMDEQTRQRVGASGGLGVGVVIIGLLCYFIIWPTYHKIMTLRENIEEAAGYLTKLEKKTNDVRAAHSAYENLTSNDLALLDEVVSNYSNLPLALKLLTYLATEVANGSDGVSSPLYINSVAISQLPMDAPCENGKLTIKNAPCEVDDSLKVLQPEYVDITLTMTGDYQAVREYVQKVKGLRHNFYLQALNISATEHGAGNILSANITVRYYYFN